MSELIQKNDNRATIRWKLLTGASALALTAYVTTGAARAEDSDHPPVWFEFGGQMEQIQGISAPVDSHFMNITPATDIYKGIDFLSNQNAARYSFGEEAAITFQPGNSGWKFSAGIRYGRSHSSRHKHNQHSVPSLHFTAHYTYLPATFGSQYAYTAPFTKYFKAKDLADVQTRSSEQHLVLDFQAGKDVGLGLFGSGGSSTVNAGLRFASFTTKSGAYITARPSVGAVPYTFSVLSGAVDVHLMAETFREYVLRADALRSFKGFGPTLSWAASADLAGNPENGELTFDWGVNAAMLFGKQKAKVHHETRAYQYFRGKYVTGVAAYSSFYDHPHHRTASRNVTVPNIGGYAGLSVKYPNVKFTIGYRYDTFLNAMDTGIDAAKKSNVTFNGPFASISIGLGD